MQFYKPQLKPQNLNPDTLTLNQLIAYRGKDMHRLSTTYRNFKRFSKPFLMITFITGITAWVHSKRISDLNLKGDDNKGGHIIKLRSRNTESDFDYSREFQRMNYLSEPDVSKVSTTTLELGILRKGGKVALDKPIGDTRKKAPHYKYY